MPSDIDIAQATRTAPIADIAAGLGIPGTALEPYGRAKAKVSLDYLASLPENPAARLVLVTAISPTPPGEGKTTASVGLADGLRAIGLRAMVCLREPSLGPVFGQKGGAAGGGRAQVVPMEDINLHFTGDFSAIGLANNLLAALIDNHVHHGNHLGIDVRRITWKRVLDFNDRALRDVTIALGGPGNGYPRQDGFDIVAASEIMAIFCLADSLDDLRDRLGRIVVGYTRDRLPVRASDLDADGAMTVLLKDALAPNLVQTLEGTPAFVHGGPFANIAHGSNSVLATRSALRLADYVVTEAGFGADLGAEKFVDITCRASGLRPSAAVIVATARALKYHGGQAPDRLAEEDLDALRRGIDNLARHVGNVRDLFGIPCVVGLNRFDTDTPAELDLLQRCGSDLGVDVVLATHWADGGAGATDLAKAVVSLADQPSAMSFVYPDGDSLWAKATAVATRVYGAREVTAGPKVRARLVELEEEGYGHLPVCIAKTQFSFSTDPALRGAPSGHVLGIREVRLAAGAGFIVLVCGDVMTMPGLPAHPASERIDLVDGRVVGLF
ncbi:MAG: formate--tetrahydrofolate ligase [Candidatus Nanopelagicales bacterium]